MGEKRDLERKVEGKNDEKVNRITEAYHQYPPPPPPNSFQTHQEDSPKTWLQYTNGVIELKRHNEGLAKADHHKVMHIMLRYCVT